MGKIGLSVLALLLLPLSFLRAQAQAPPAKQAKMLLDQVDRVMKEVERLSGMPFLEPVAKGILTEKQFKDFARKEMEKDYPAWKIDAEEEVLKRLGLLDRGKSLRKEAIKLMGAQVAAFYDPDSKVFRLVKGRSSGKFSLVIMAHELTHALDDQYYGLKLHQEQAKACWDSSFAQGAVAEGSATVLQMRYFLEKLKEGKFTQEDMNAQMKIEKAQSKDLAEAPPTLVADLVSRYMMGMYFLSKGNIRAAQSGCRAAVEAAMFDPPLSSEQVLHPAKYWDPLKRDQPVEIFFPRARLVMGAGWRCLDMDTLGEIQCALLARPRDFKFKIQKALMANPGFWTNRAAAGWGGDKYALYKNRKGEKALIWVAAWDTLEDAAQFLRAFREYRGDLPAAVLAKGKVTAFAFGMEKDRAALVLEALLPRLRFRKAGPWNPGFEAPRGRTRRG